MTLVFGCPFCPEWFEHSYERATHIRAQHRERIDEWRNTGRIGPARCRVCGAEFIREEGLTEHIAKEHTYTPDATQLRPTVNKRTKRIRQMDRNLSAALFAVTDNLNTVGRKLLRSDETVTPDDLTYVQNQMIDALIILRQIQRKVELL